MGSFSEKEAFILRKTIRVTNARGKYVDKEINYIPVRYIIAALLTLFSILAIIGIVVALCYFVPYFYLSAYLTAFACLVRLISSDDNPDYKVPWIVFVMVLPIAGFMLYLMFYSRKLHKKFIRRLSELKIYRHQKCDDESMRALELSDPTAATQAKMLTRIASTALYENTKTTYYPSGEQMHAAMLQELEKAENFILLEFFIIEEGKFWNSILKILERKVKEGVTVRVCYDDIGCMSTLPGNYAKHLQQKGIDAVPFSRLRGNADSEFNNRNHRKILVIDGKVGFTGGVNIADEYINEVERFGHWKDVGLRLEGEGVFELTSLALCDFALNVKKMPPRPKDCYPTQPEIRANGYLIPFGDGPRPLYVRRVGKSVIQNMLNTATRYAYITTPYLIIDNDLCTCLENAALRGVDVRIILPHIPDKKLVFAMSQSFYKRLMDADVRIYEYKPGFIHAKTYLVDDTYAMVGTINLDYRSLVHHFENGVWMYRCDCLPDIKKDIEQTLDKSILVTTDMLKTGHLRRFFRALVRIFAPLM
ncbi:MAG: cardiolipin synthase [Ruminococcaceae bacterium]|nr:cardiolipin synthase [Oscillospiraceae bacterium]